MISNNQQKHEVSMTALLIEYHNLMEQLEQNGEGMELVSDLRTRLQSVASRITPAILARYEHIRQRHKLNGKHPLVEVKNGSCWCGCKVPAYQRFLLRIQVQTCQQCGRLLLNVPEHVIHS